MISVDSTRRRKYRPIDPDKPYGWWAIVCRGQRRGYWLCRCNCGTEREVIAASLYTGKSISCGCYRASRHHRQTHGESRHGLYQRWRAMRRRCQKSGYVGFANYGGRGITVCERWHSFENFLEDMGPSYPGKGWSIDRFPNQNGNYEPGNCRWATAEQQGRNTRKNIWIEWDGQTKTMAEWVAVLGVKYLQFYKRYKKYGVQRAFALADSPARA